MTARSSRALNNAQILRAGFVVLLGFFASGVLGLVRTAVFNATFGATAELEAFYAAQRIPEMVFTLVAGGALGSSFIPVFSRFLTADDNDGAWRLASAVMTLSALAAITLAVLGIIFSPFLVQTVIFPGRPPDQQALAMGLTRLMLLTTIIFAISGLVMGILNAHQRFLFPALALSMNNIGLIAGALLIAPALAPYGGQIGDYNVYGLAWGAILGALLHLGVQLPGLISVRARLRILPHWHVSGVREVLTLMGPRVLGLAVVQINFIVNVAFASAMIEGSIVVFTTAWVLMFFVLGIIAQSMGTAVFPSLSALAAENDMDGYRDRLASAMRSVLFLAFPASVGLIVLGEPVIATMYQRGDWTAEATRGTAWALTFLALGIAGHSLLEVLSRAFYALADTWTPVRIGIAAMVTNIVFSIIFIQFIGDPDSLTRGAFAGLALANSLTTLLEAAVLWWLLRQRVNGVKDSYVLVGAGKALLAALGMGLVVWITSDALDSRGHMVQMAVGVGVGAGMFFILALALRLDEVGAIVRRFKPVRTQG